MAPDRTPRAATGLRAPGPDAALNSQSPIEYLYGPGSTQRPHRVRRRLEQWLEDARLENPQLDADHLQAEAERRLLAELESSRNPKALKALAATAPTSCAPVRSDLFEFVEIAAMLRAPEGQELRRVLESSPRCGRPSDRRLAAALALRNFLGDGRKELEAPFKDFMTNTPALDWAFEHPLNGNGGRSLKAARKTLAAALNRHDPETPIALNLQAIRRLRNMGHPDIGRYIAVDGIGLEGHFEQRQGVNNNEKRLLSRATEASYGFHEAKNEYGLAKAWRGWTGIVLVDIKSTLPLTWVQRPANANEGKALFDVLDVLFELWPDCPAEYIVGDSAYDGEELALQLERDYSLHPVFPLRGSVSANLYDHAKTFGVPECSKHGLMKLEWPGEGFLSPEKRAMHGLSRGESAGHLFKARIRWVCEGAGCPARETTWTHRNARIYTYAPRSGEHRLACLRKALQVRRGAVESVFASAEDKGFALKGEWHPKWAWKDDHMLWLVGGGFLAQTLRRLTHETGGYDQALNEARSRNLVRM